LNLETEEEEEEEEEGLQDSVVDKRLAGDRWRPPWVLVEPLGELQDGVGRRPGPGAGGEVLERMSRGSMRSLGGDVAL